MCEYCDPKSRNRLDEFERTKIEFQVWINDDLLKVLDGNLNYWSIFINYCPICGADIKKGKRVEYDKKSVLTDQGNARNKQTSLYSISLSRFKHLRKLETEIYDEILDLNISVEQKDRILGNLNDLLNGAEEVISWIK